MEFMKKFLQNIGIGLFTLSPVYTGFILADLVGPGNILALSVLTNLIIVVMYYQTIGE